MSVETPRYFMIEWTDESTAVDRFANAKVGFHVFQGKDENDARENFKQFTENFSTPLKLRIDKVTEVYNRPPGGKSGN